MRIRRLASKILGTASSILSHPPVATVAAHVSAVYVCELNRSPWDVFVYPSPPPTPPPPPSDETLEIEEGTMGDQMGGEEATSMVTSLLASTGIPELVPGATDEESSKNQEKNDNKRKLPAKIAKKAKERKVILKTDTGYIESVTGAVSTTDLSSNIVGMPEEEVTAVRPESNGMQEEHHTKPKLARKKFEMPDGKMTIMEKEIDYVESNGPFTCKKTDGKQWQCKRPANQPNSFCNYHIVQHRSYSNKKVKAPAVVTLCNQTQRNTATIPTVEGISNYPALGPWLGTGQGREDIDCIRSVAMEQSKTEDILEGNIGNVEATTEQSKNEDILECDISNVEVTTEQSKTEDILECDISNVTHEEDSLEASEEEEKPKRKNANPVSRKRKRRRKPVKVRSLESLM